jgi:hypothetical protein
MICKGRNSNVKTDKNLTPDLPQDSIPIVMCEHRFTEVYKSHTASCKNTMKRRRRRWWWLWKELFPILIPTISFFNSFCLHFAHIHIRGLFFFRIRTWNSPAVLPPQPMYQI